MSYIYFPLQEINNWNTSVFAVIKVLKLYFVLTDASGFKLLPYSKFNFIWTLLYIVRVYYK